VQTTWNAGAGSCGSGSELTNITRDICLKTATRASCALHQPAGNGLMPG
jgi:hypothetical protein